MKIRQILSVVIVSAIFGCIGYSAYSVITAKYSKEQVNFINSRYIVPIK